jgi:hypothetical protein
MLLLLVAEEQKPDKYTVVVEVKLYRNMGTLKPKSGPAVIVAGNDIVERKDKSGKVADDVLVQPPQLMAVPPKLALTFPHTSQSPAVREIDVILMVAFVERTPEAFGITLDTNSPTFPALALSAAVVPIIPPVVGLNANDVAVATPRIGVTNVGEVDPAKVPVPVWPLSETSTLLFVAMFKSF